MSSPFAASPFDRWLVGDPEVSRLLGEEAERQSTTLQLIASENFTSPAVLAATGSDPHQQVRRGLSRAGATTAGTRSSTRSRTWPATG